MRSVSTASNTPQQQAPASLDQVEIFRPGKRRAMNGQVYEITAADGRTDEPSVARTGRRS